MSATTHSPANCGSTVEYLVVLEMVHRAQPAVLVSDEDDDEDDEDDEYVDDSELDASSASHADDDMDDDDASDDVIRWAPKRGTPATRSAM